MNLKSAIIISVSILLLSPNIYAQTEKKKRKSKNQKIEIAWEAYDTLSTFSIDSINISILQGYWEAYKGLYKFGDVINGMDLTKPMIVEVKDSTYRRNTNSEFYDFKIEKNMIIKYNTEKVDIGYINKLTENELTISWKNNQNYTRYYYKK